MLPTQLANSNLVVAGVVFIAVLLLSFGSRWFGWPAVPRNKQEGWALGLWTIPWVCFVITFLMLPKVGQHDFALGAELAISDIGSLAGIGFAIAYAQGSRFRWRQLDPLAVGVLLLAWDLTAPQVFHGPTYRLVVIAPAVVVANIKNFAVGWVFVVRWGVVGLPLLLLNSAYGMLQLPGYLDAYVIRPFELDSLFPSLEKIFIFLALGKFLLAVGFFILFFSSDLLDMSEPRYLPSRERILPHRAITRALLWLAGIVVAAVGGAVTTVLSHTFRGWIENLLGR
jgi:hypothetical protein